MPPVRQLEAFITRNAGWETKPAPHFHCTHDLSVLSIVLVELASGELAREIREEAILAGLQDG